MSGPPLAQINSDIDSEAEDDYLSGLQDDFAELHADSNGKPSSDEKTLDDYLDQLLGDEPEEPASKTIEEPTEPSDDEPSNFEMPSEEELDHLFDSIITEEIKSKSSEEAENFTSPAPLPENDLEEDNLDALFDEIMDDIDSEGPEKNPEDAEEREAVLSEPDSLTKESDEMNEDFSGLFNDETQEMESEESDFTIPSIRSKKEADPKIPEEAVLSEEEVWDQILLEEDEEITSDANTPESTDSESAVHAPEDQENPEEVLTESATGLEEEASAVETPEANEKKETTEEQDDEKSDDDLWAEAFADQEALKETPEEDAQETTAKEEAAEGQDAEKSDDDLWAEAFADQEALKETPEEDAEETTAKEEAAEEQDAEKSDDDLWAEAFADQEALKETPEEVAEETTAKEEADSDSQEDAEESETTAETDPEEESADDENLIPELEYDGEDEDDEVAEAEADDPYDEYEDDEEEYEPPSKKKSGIFALLPSTLTGKLVLGGSVLALLLTGGGAYFALQALAPPELMQMGKTESVVDDALKPKQVEDTLNSNQQVSGSETASVNPQEQAPASALNPDESSGEVPDIAKELGRANNSLEVTKNPDVPAGLIAGLTPSTHAVELTTIMPVAYNVNDIRVLSFSLEAEMSDAESAQVVREAMPVFEKITISTVEQLLEKKFFNDILYVQEKLKKDLQANFNKTLEGGGRVKKINFKEFTIQ